MKNKMADSTYSNITSFKEYIFFVAGIISMATYKFLSWLMPKTAEIFWEGLKKKIREFQEANQTKTQIEMMKKIEEISHALENYKDEKHRISGELAEVKDAIVNDDKEKLSIIKEIYSRQAND